jgi:hypothetical protein
MVYPAEVVKRLAEADSERVLPGNQHTYGVKPKGSRGALHQTRNKTFHELLNKSIKRTIFDRTMLLISGSRSPRSGGRSVMRTGAAHLGNRIGMQIYQFDDYSLSILQEICAHVR